MFNQLTQIRKQLVSHQSSLNESLAAIDALIDGLLNSPSGDSRNISNINYADAGVINGTLKHIATKRGKIVHVLAEANEPITAKEVKERLLAYGEDLPNVDQSLVNLEKAGIISFTTGSGRKKYFLKK